MATMTGNNLVCERLQAATQLEWFAPPQHASLLLNGYYAYAPTVLAPRLVQQLRDLALRAMGRPCHIMFKESRRGQSVINIPTDVAEDPDFLIRLSGASFQLPSAGIIARGAFITPVFERK